MRINIRDQDYQVVKWIADTYLSGFVHVLCLCCEAWINTLKDCPVTPIELDPVAVFLRHSKGRRRNPPVQPVPTRREYRQVKSGIRGGRIRNAAYFLGIPATQAWHLAVQEGVHVLKAAGQPTPPWLENEDAIPVNSAIAAATAEAIPVNSAIAAATAEQVLWLAEVLEAGWAPCCAQRLRAQLEARAKEII